MKWAFVGSNLVTGRLRVNEVGVCWELSCHGPPAPGGEVGGAPPPAAPGSGLPPGSAPSPGPSPGLPAARHFFETGSAGGEATSEPSHFARSFSPSLARFVGAASRIALSPGGGGAL